MPSELPTPKETQKEYEVMVKKADGKTQQEDDDRVKKLYREGGTLGRNAAMLSQGRKLLQGAIDGLRRQQLSAEHQVGAATPSEGADAASSSASSSASIFAEGAFYCKNCGDAYLLCRRWVWGHGWKCAREADDDDDAQWRVMMQPMTSSEDDDMVKKADGKTQKEGYRTRSTHSLAVSGFPPGTSLHPCGAFDLSDLPGAATSTSTSPSKELDDMFKKAEWKAQKEDGDMVNDADGKTPKIGSPLARHHRQEEESGVETALDTTSDEGACILGTDGGPRSRSRHRKDHNVEARERWRAIWTGHGGGRAMMNYHVMKAREAAAVAECNRGEPNGVAIPMPPSFQTRGAGTLGAGIDDPCAGARITSQLSADAWAAGWASTNCMRPRTKTRARARPESKGAGQGQLKL